MQAILLLPFRTLPYTVSKSSDSMLYFGRFHSCFLPVKWHRAHSELKSDLYHFIKSLLPSMLEWLSFHVAAKHILVDIHRCTSSPTETPASLLWYSSDGYWMVTVGKPGRLGMEEPAGGASHLSRTSLQGHLGSRASEFMCSGKTLISLWETLSSLLWITRSHDSSYWHLTWRCDHAIYVQPVPG